MKDAAFRVSKIKYSSLKDCWFVGSRGSWQTHLFSMCCYGKMTFDTYYEPVVPHHIVHCVHCT